MHPNTARLQHPMLLRWRRSGWRLLGLGLLGLLVLGGCSTASSAPKSSAPKSSAAKLSAAKPAAQGASMSEARYFSDPKSAVAKIAELIGNQDWVTLSRYYDLSGSGLERSELESGAFFVRTERPELAHPGEFWRIRHPFDPRFSYQSQESLPGNRVRVHLFIEIDQGGGMVQRGLQTFLMRKSEHGVQVLPPAADGADGEDGADGAQEKPTLPTRAE